MHFVLVHGAYHGAWCWERLIPELEVRGHRATAVDLPIGDPDAGASEYADQIAANLDGDDSVVVGHSMMGLAIPVVPQRSSVKRLVFLCGFVPEPGSSFNEVRAREEVETQRQLQRVQFTDIGGGVWMIGPDTANELFFHDADQELSAWALPQLRPQSYRIMNEQTPLMEWPEVDCSYILCRSDRAVNPEWARRVAGERFGNDALELDGGHSPFLTRPAELADLLHRVST
ncbi:MAG: alpha/beta fold hydrolase [Actinomycetota bacterium]|nr:alpha/beta fold hydrolase [Actinomycetota bacterium]